MVTEYNPVPSLFIGSQLCHLVIEPINIRFYDIRFNEVADGVNGVGNGKHQITVHIPPVVAKISFLNGLLVGCIQDSSTHEHQHDVPVAFIQSLSAHCSGYCSRDQGVGSIIFVSQPSQSTFSQPQRERSSAKKTYYC